MKRIVSPITGLLLDIFYPPSCCVCKGRIETDRERQRQTPAAIGCGVTQQSFASLMWRVICPSCAEGFEPVEGPICTKCGELFKGDVVENHVCGECIGSPKKFQAARAAGVYSGPLMAAIHAFKYNKKTALAGPLGELLFLSFTRWFDPGKIDTVVPVPLHKEKLKKRGFNQAYLLVKNWHKTARALGLCFEREKIAKTALARVKKTASQTALSRKQRMENVKGAFAVEKEDGIAGKRVLLVDDVYTTGATINECAKVLIKNGAARVDALTLARACRVL